MIGFEIFVGQQYSIEIFAMFKALIGPPLKCYFMIVCHLKEIIKRSVVAILHFTSIYPANLRSCVAIEFKSTLERIGLSNPLPEL